MTWSTNLIRDEGGQDLIEYALLAGFLSFVAVAAIANVGAGVNTVYGSIDTQVQAIPGAGDGASGQPQAGPSSQWRMRVLDENP